MVEQNLHKDHPHVQTKRLWKDHKRGWAVIMVLLMFATAAVKDNAQHLQLSVLTIPEHATFDGTVYPVQNVPDWLNTTGDEQDMLFGSFPAEKLLDIPSYDTSRLSVNDLTWGDVEDDYTRVMQNTYPVVYAGTYRLDGIEGIGSHPAVDIKALTGTPTYSIMNGYVERVSYSSYGFGNLVVIRHNNVPSPENSSVGTTLFSGYAHLDSVNVNEGDVVTKGQQIGTIGDTGTATTPHLHFQIDTAAAPWHLYWPFTTAEANAVGGFFEAVNQGVGLDKVYTNTTHPMDYVQNYLDVDTEIILSSVDEASTEEEIIEEEVVEEEDAEDVVIDVETTDVITEEEIVEEVGPVFDHMEFDFNPYMEDGISQLLKISLVDERGEYILSPELEEDIVVTVSDAEILSTTEILTGEDFTKGYVSIEVETVATGFATLSFDYLEDTYTTDEIAVTGQLKPLDSLAIETDGEFYLGEAEPIVIVALNEDLERLPSFELPEPIQFEVLTGDGFFSRHALTENDFEDGMATLEFTPLSDESITLRVYSGEEIAGVSTELMPTLFVDLEADDPYYSAIAYLKALGVVQGYEDHTFRSDEAVSRVEILKMMYEAFMKELIAGSNLDFPDTDSTAWYAPYVATAQQEGIVQGDGNTGMFRPGDSVNRVEAIKILSLALGVDVDPVVIGNPFEDVHYLDWYAPYAQFGQQANILPWDSDTLDVGESMTRGEVAEMIYRVIAIQQNSAENYSSELVVN